MSTTPFSSDPTPAEWRHAFEKKNHERNRFPTPRPPFPIRARSPTPAPRESAPFRAEGRPSALSGVATPASSIDAASPRRRSRVERSRAPPPLTCSTALSFFPVAFAGCGSDMFFEFLCKLVWVVLRCPETWLFDGQSVLFMVVRLFPGSERGLKSARALGSHYGSYTEFRFLLKRKTLQKCPRNGFMCWKYEHPLFFTFLWYETLFLPLCFR